MDSLKPWISPINRSFALALALCLAGVPQALAQSAQSTTQNQPAQQPQQQNPNSTLMPDPSKGPLQPAATQSQELPNAPSSTSAQPQTTVTAPPDQGQAQQPAAKPEPPLGAAAAEAGAPAGGLASKPAGNAIAPAKQRQVRSMLIKVGAIAAGAAALGIVYGLTRATPSTPPGAAGATTTGH